MEEKYEDQVIERIKLRLRACEVGRKKIFEEIVAATSPHTKTSFDENDIIRWGHVMERLSKDHNFLWSLLEMPRENEKS